MKLEILVSAMNQNDMSLVKKMNLKTDALIINQCDRDKSEEMQINSINIRMLSYNERGLSKSRNRAIENANGDICLIADDDVSYYDGIEDQILSIVESNPDTSIYVFRLDNHRKNKYKQSKFNFFDILKVSSVQIAFKRQDISAKSIKFLECFGTGSGKYLLGEENIFLNECLRKKLEIRYYPLTIGYMNDSPSSWFTGQNEKYFYDKGAAFYELSPSYWRLMALGFTLKKYRTYKAQISFISALRSVIKGANSYKKEKYSIN